MAQLGLEASAPLAARATAARSLRIAVGAVGFSLYGLLALGMGLVWAPLDRLLRGAQGADLRVQRAIHRGTRAWLWACEALAGCRVRFRNPERLVEGPLLIVANHPSLVDSPFLTSQLPEADFVVSGSWTENPILRHAIRAAGYLREDAGTALIREAVARLRAGRRVVMYPEGSRTPPGGIAAFHRGIAHIALRAGCDILPVVIRVEPRTLMKGQTFLDMPAEVPVWELDVGEPWRASELVAPGESRSAAARRITAELRDYFERRTEGGC